MASKALAVKYRPQTFEEVTEQEILTTILKQQISSKQIQHCYLFCGPAGCGKTTCARIFANEINGGQGIPVELDAASNNGVEDVRNIIQQAQTKSLDSEYKVFIIDECHSLSNAGWQAFLKLLEEPPAKSIFIFCTTDPQKIPKTILSRVQRYDFQRISQQGIVHRLQYILANENIIVDQSNIDAIEYIAKLADGGMRDAISLADKCLAFTDELTLETVVKVLGVVDYDEMFKFTDTIIENKLNESIQLIESVYTSGKDLKQFVKQYIQFLLDIQKYAIGCDWKYISLPRLSQYEEWLKGCGAYEFDRCFELLDCMLKINNKIKYSSVPKCVIETEVLLTFGGVNED